ncbi:MAG: sigma-70 family RNA polymerase sigma factor [Bacteroidales bacterium]|jgi:RNA polymerase sigma factor (sigma-70 family)|nr:sigma-70 family RNA polymerase sigma factor [Bacteroidales bacterium]MDD2569569.1 sigma-70 family RNA polymerase sigma factor [Bacteroidales bacterium]MDD2813112.1 sigma-70 family RNA polymerase sigma factor [Bacteroidales bacterium]MDD3385739.1 sigma-70 family RNA polymerase sigma factor [Bacteroidales bacterium]MDD3811660.1 sigma-70 family RNA polymerase sigma factor [Bacteroidales bacterium]
MKRNDLETKMLRENPSELLISFQPIIRIIVRKLCSQGFLSRVDTPDLVQEVNRKLIERMPRIQEQYDGRCQLRTYLSVVARNICLEEFRKPHLVSEPRAEVYEQVDENPVWNQLIIKQEYQRLERAVTLFGREKGALWTTLRSFADLPVRPDDLTGFEQDPGEVERERLAGLVNQTINKMKKDKLEALGVVFAQLRKKHQNAEALRKWSTNRISELISMMNGNPQSCSYTPETLFLLIEKAQIGENSD